MKEKKEQLSQKQKAFLLRWETIFIKLDPSEIEKQLLRGLVLEFYVELDNFVLDDNDKIYRDKDEEEFLLYVSVDLLKGLIEHNYVEALSNIRYLCMTGSLFHPYNYDMILLTLKKGLSYDENIKKSFAIKG